MSKTVIETHALSISYVEHRGIKDVNLCLEKGEVFGFLDPNGAGKPTTQRVLLDIIHPNSGQAYIFRFDTQKKSVETCKNIDLAPLAEKNCSGAGLKKPAMMDARSSSPLTFLPKYRRFVTGKDLSWMK
ncbi:MAG: ATP-binding cassette domain-containing protein [Anaerolineaceae bacterium]|nr:ATP-binding cassette domain-containing protein [Anaerolineaceae bacterium]